MSDQRLLYSQEAELAVIGSILLDNGAIDRVGDKHHAGRLLRRRQPRDLPRRARAVARRQEGRRRVAVRGRCSSTARSRRPAASSTSGTILQATPGSANVRALRADIVRDRAARARPALRVRRDLDAGALAGPVGAHGPRAARWCCRSPRTRSIVSRRMIRPLLTEFIEQLEKRNERDGRAASACRPRSATSTRPRACIRGSSSSSPAARAWARARSRCRSRAQRGRAGKRDLVFSLEMSGHRARGEGGCQPRQGQRRDDARRQADEATTTSASRPRWDACTTRS
jgi:hypothetical protein